MKIDYKLGHKEKNQIIPKDRNITDNIWSQCNKTKKIIKILIMNISAKILNRI